MQPRPNGGVRCPASPTERRQRQRFGVLAQATRERGDIILGWLTRIAVGVAMVAVVGFDGLSIGVAHFTASDDADNAANAASTAWHDKPGDMQAALLAAENSVATHGETVVPNTLTIDPDGTAHIKVRRSATTLIVHHIGALRSWTTITAAGSGRYVA